jgi:hypothetical protein
LGRQAHLDPLAIYLKNIFQKIQLVDIVLNDVAPTWRNGKKGREDIEKRLDQFYLSEELISSVGRHRSWINYPFVSDHAPVLLQLGNFSNPISHPFKLNPSWLRDDSFYSIIKEVCSDHVFLQESGA